MIPSTGRRLPVGADRYKPAAMFLHWVIALGILAAVGMGLYMTVEPMTPIRFRVINWHKWLGILLLAATMARCIYRACHRPPPHVPPLSRMQHLAAGAVHAALYVLCLTVPLAGWAQTSAVGRPVVFFGMLRLPDIAPPDSGLADTLKDAHHLLAWALVILIALHAAAAIKHHLIDRDGVLARMLPRLSHRSSL